MQSDGNLVVYAGGGGPGSGGALWSSGTWGNSGAYATVQDDGNLVVYKSGGGPGVGGGLWSSGTYARSETIGSGTRLRAGWWTQAKYTRLVVQLDGNLVMVGAPAEPLPLAVFSLLMPRKHVSGSLIGGIAETQEMLDFCGKHNIVCDIELIPMQKINDAYERLLKSDVKYRFVIDMATLK